MSGEENRELFDQLRKLETKALHAKHGELEHASHTITAFYYPRFFSIPPVTDTGTSVSKILKD
jgi:hypothetical protein